MKLNKILLMAVIAVGLVACNNKEDIPESVKPGEGNAYAGLYIATQSKTRGTRDIGIDYDGKDAESTVKKLNLLSTATEKEWVYSDTPAEDDATKFWDTGSKIFTVKPWKTEAGAQSMALILNQNTNITTTIGEAPNQTIGTSDNAIDDIAALTDGTNGFVMTSNVENKTITSNIDEPTVKAGSTEDKNVFTFDIERVVAQGIVKKAGSLKTETNDGKGKVKLDDITFAAINGAVPTYLYRNNAGARKMADASPFYYKKNMVNGVEKEYKSAIDDYLSSDYSAGKVPTDVKENLIRLGNLAPHSGGKTNNDLGGYKALSISEALAETKDCNGIYFLENSVVKTGFTKENKDHGFRRLAYAKVYATYTPNKVLHFEGGKLVEKDGVEGQTFVLGAKDNLIYIDKEAAKKSALHPDQEAYTYTNGRCAYRALWNRQLDGKTLMNADTRRNNVYLLEIEAFQGLGIPHDPSDPDDPNLPKPDPDPEYPDDPDVEKEDTYMKVVAKVLPWNLVSRKVTLD